MIRLRALLIPASLSTALLLAGCLGATVSEEPLVPASLDGAVPRPLRIVADDHAFSAPSSVPAGLVEVTLENRGTQLHHATFYRLEPGRTFGEFVDAFIGGHGATPPWATAYGGPNVALPGGAQTAYLDLDAGEYVLACAIPSPDGEMHAEKGMVAPLTVVAAGRTAAAPPAPDVTLALRDFAFEVAGELRAGENVVRIVNEGEHTHEVVVFELFGNATPQEFLHAMESEPGSPPPGRPVGGTTPLSKGKEVTTTLELAPGRYFLVCFDVTGSPQGEPHLALGMLQEFVVQD